MKFFIAFDLLLEKMSRYALISCLFGILFLAVGAIVLRWMGESLMWIDPLVRHLVFLSAFLGGSLATSKGVHIKIDLLAKLLEKYSSDIPKWIHRNLINIFCFVVTLVLTKASWDFYLSEKEFGSPAFLEIHSAYLVGIIPFGFALINLRFFHQLLFGLFGEKSEHHRL
jgi:TRAP-type C4-dicarboxylate transport system permease small subunit